MDDFLDKHPRFDAVYTAVYRKTVLPLRRLRHVYPNWKLRRQFRPGGFYLDHGNLPCVLVSMDDGEMLTGVSLVDGNLIGGCSIFACGPEPTTRVEALALAVAIRAERESSDGPE